MNQHLTIHYPCGCKWMIPTNVNIVPRNCPDHWLADKPIKIEPEEERNVSG